MKRILGLIFLCLVWGSTWVAIKISLEGFPPLLGAGSRFFSAFLFLFLYIKLKKISIRIKARETRILLVSAFLIYVMDYGMLYWGEQYLSAGVTAIFFATFAMFTALMSNFVFKNEPFRLRQFSGLLIGFGGIMTVFYDQLVITSFNLKVILGISAVLVAALSAAIALVMIKKYLPDVNPVTLTFHQVWTGTAMLFLLGFAAEDPGLIHANFKVVTAILYLGVIGSMLAFVVYYKLLKQMSAISLSLIIYVIPLIALVTDFLYYGEVIELRSVVGMFIIFCGIWLSREHKKKA